MSSERGLNVNTWLHLINISWKIKWRTFISSFFLVPWFASSLPLSGNRTILGGHTDTSIDLSDPISDRFYKEVWMTTAGRNATIYEKVRGGREVKSSGWGLKLRHNSQMSSFLKMYVASESFERARVRQMVKWWSVFFLLFFLSFIPFSHASIWSCWWHNNMWENGK